MNGVIMNSPSPYELYPPAAEWLTKLLRTAQAPVALREDAERLKLHLFAYLGSQTRPGPSHFAANNLLSSDHVRSSCPTCGQMTVVDASKEKCPICAKVMVVRRNRTNGQAFLGCSGYPVCRGTINLSVLLLRKAEEERRAQQLNDEGLRRIDL